MKDTEQIKSVEDLVAKVLAAARGVREDIEPHFHAETSVEGVLGNPPSRGHCGAVAVLMYVTFGFRPVSTTVNGQSHWFNRVEESGFSVDVDLTGDQFGLDPVQVAAGGSLYPDTRVRSYRDISMSTVRRTDILFDKLIAAARKRQDGK